MSEYKKINVSLYGGKPLFGGKEQPLEAEEIYCDKTEQCTFYKQGKCLKIRDIGANCGCKFGRIERQRGYTSRSQKYILFQSKYRNDDVYNKLEYPYEHRIALIDDYVWIKLDDVAVQEKDDGIYYVKDIMFDRGSWIERKAFNIDLLEKICDSKPQYMFSSSLIEKYRDKVVPELLYQMKKLIPELYSEFVKKHPEYNKAPDHVGKKAYVKSLNKNSKLIDGDGNVFVFDDEYLICHKYCNWHLPFKANNAEVKIKITDDMTYDITDNEQVNESTVFKM